LLALGSAAARGTPGELAVGTDDSYLLAPGFMFLEDREGKLTLQEILRPEAQAAFRPVPPIGPGANFGLTRSAFWLRIDLRTSLGAPADWLLEVAYPPLDSLQLYSPDAAFGMERQSGYPPRGDRSSAALERHSLDRARRSRGESISRPRGQPRPRRLTAAIARPSRATCSRTGPHARAPGGDLRARRPTN